MACEDGRDFIRTIVERAWKDPFPGYAPPKSSRAKAKEAQLRRRRNVESLSVNSGENPSSIVPQETDPEDLKIQPRRAITHFVMNLPDSAITFLDAFRGILNSATAGGASTYDYPHLPMVHCHCFTKELDPEKAAEDIRQVRVTSHVGIFGSPCPCQRAEEKLGCKLGDDEEVSLHLVRSVAPNKNMYCISFRLPREVAFAAV